MLNSIPVACNVNALSITVFLCPVTLGFLWERESRDSAKGSASRHTHTHTLV